MPFVARPCQRGGTGRSGNRGHPLSHRRTRRNIYLRRGQHRRIRLARLVERRAVLPELLDEIRQDTRARDLPALRRIVGVNLLVERRLLQLGDGRLDQPVLRAVRHATGPPGEQVGLVDQAPFPVPLAKDGGPQRFGGCRFLLGIAPENPSRQGPLLFGQCLVGRSDLIDVFFRRLQRQQLDLPLALVDLRHPFADCGRQGPRGLGQAT